MSFFVLELLGSLGGLGNGNLGRVGAEDSAEPPSVAAEPIFWLAGGENEPTDATTSSSCSRSGVSSSIGRLPRPETRLGNLMLMPDVEICWIRVLRLVVEKKPPGNRMHSEE